MPDPSHEFRGPPPPIRRRWPRPLAVIGCGVMVAAVLLLVVMNIESPEPPPAQSSLLNAESKFATPPTLTETDLAGTGISAPKIGDIEASAGWIETVDPETGRTVQRYRFDRLDPDPPGRPEGWFAMERPEAEVHLSENRVLELRGDSAIARAPNRTLESGTITGDVEITVREPAAGETLRVTTQEASFDNVLGEVRCPDAVHISTPTAQMPGHGVTLRFDDRNQRVAFEMRSLDYLHLQASPSDSEPRATAAPAPVPVPDSPTPAPPPTDTDPPDFYQLTFHDNVVIRHGPADDRRTAAGSLLTVLFSSQSEGASVTAAAPAAVPAAPRPLVDVLSRLAFATPPAGDGAAPEPGPGEVVITCDGRVSLTPLETPDARLTDPEDVVLVLSGAPAALRDDARALRATCAALEYRLAEDAVELRGDADTPMVAVLPDAVAHGDRFTFDLAAGVGGFVGAGHFEITAPTDADDDPGDGAPVVIAWSESATFELLPGTGANDAPRLRRAEFVGGVGVHGDELDVATDRMTVAFSETDAGESVIETIEARGAVRANRVGASGAMRCEQLTVFLEDDGEGGSSPTRLEARDAVQAELEGRTLWCRSLDVAFIAGPETRAERAVASGAVQVRLEDGSRAFAETLRADGTVGTIVLEGERVLIAAERLVIDGGTRLELDRETETALWPAAGRFQAWDDPILGLEPGPIEPPDVDAITAPPALVATWSDSMLFDSRFNDGDGAIDLVGNVQTVMRRAARERNTLTGDRLRLQLERVDRGSNADDAPDRGRRVVRRLVADGDARLESRTWATDGREGRPRVFYVAGTLVDYDRTLEEATVVDGTLLMRDERPVADEASGTAPFSGHGITMFRFDERLYFRRTGVDRYHIEMTGRVEGSHKAPDGRTATLTTRFLEADATRDASGDAAGADSDGFGGAMRLTRIHARGAVYVSTPTRRVDCDDLVHDVIAGRAHLTADPGRIVTLLTVGSVQPVTAQSIAWDLVTDAIEMQGISGGR